MPPYIHIFSETGSEDWVALADVDTPSGVLTSSGVLESTRLSQEVDSSRPSLSTENSVLSAKSGNTDEDPFQEPSINNTQRTRFQEPSISIIQRTQQTPTEITAALSAAVGDLDLEDFETITTPQEGNVDATQDYTQFGSHHHISGSANHSTQAQTNNHSNEAENKDSKEDTASQPQKMQREKRNLSIASQTSSTGSQSKGPFTCSECEKECATKAGLKSHQRVHK